jgi:hypothetical protein
MAPAERATAGPTVGRAAIDTLGGFRPELSRSSEARQALQGSRRAPGTHDHDRMTVKMNPPVAG